VNGNNTFTLEGEIKERIIKGNKAFYANRTLLKKLGVQKIQIKFLLVSN
jgi:hypothetical protein